LGERQRAVERGCGECLAIRALGVHNMHIHGTKYKTGVLGTEPEDPGMKRRTAL
jgi:hypothetical protein